MHAPVEGPGGDALLWVRVTDEQRLRSSSLATHFSLFPDEGILSSPSSTMQLRPLRYHVRIVDFLRTHEPAVWEWFGSQSVKDQEAAEMRLDLLKSTLRLERASNESLYAAADRATTALNLSVVPTFYQAIGHDGGTNASLYWLPEGAHIVLHGDVQGSLLQVAEGAAFFSKSALLAPSDKTDVVRELDRDESQAIEIVSRTDVDETEQGGLKITNLAIR